MRLVILANASPSIGTGHVMRALSVAEEFVAEGWEVDFAGTINGVPWLSEYIQELVNIGACKISTKLEIDKKRDVLLIDSYEISEKDPFIVKSLWKNVVAIVEDFTPSFLADIYIHPGPNCNWEPPDNYFDFQYFMGTQFISVRKSIRELDAVAHSKTSTSPRLVIVGGGTDPHKFAPALVDFLSKTDLDFHASVFSSEIEPFSNDSRFDFFRLGSDLEHSIKTADVIFCTSGTMTWEMLSAGFALGIALATENQELNFNYQVTSHLALNIGEHKINREWNFNEINIVNLLVNGDLREALRKNAKNARIGFGSRLIFKIVANL